MLVLKNKYTNNYLDCGWISPNGHIIQCEYFQHTHVACEYARKNNILIDGEMFFETHGWAKISKTSSWKMHLICSDSITRQQIKAIKQFMNTFEHYDSCLFCGQYYTIDTVENIIEDWKDD